MLIIKRISQILFSERCIHAIKTTLTCLLGLVIVHLFQLPMGQWTIITILVVMSAQVHFGAALLKGSMRFIGSLSGAAIAMMTLYFFPHNAIVLDSIVLLSSLFFSYIAGISQNIGQAGTLGAVTVVILLLSPDPNLHTAMLRTIEIILGIFLALIVSIGIMPIRAQDKLQKNIANTLKHLQQYYHAIIERQSEQTHKYEEIIMKDFAQCKKLLDEAIAEPGGKKNLKKLTPQILQQEKKIFRAFSLLENYLMKHDDAVNQLSAWHPLLEKSIEHLAKWVEIPEPETLHLPEVSQLSWIEHDTHFLNFFTKFIAQELPILAVTLQQSLL